VLRNDSPNLLDRSSLLAVEAARRTSGLEIDRSLRAAVGLLPALLFEHTSGKPIQAVAISPRGDWAAAGGDDGVVRVWETTSEQEIARQEHGARVHSVVISADGGYLASASENGVLVRAMKSGRQIKLNVPAVNNLVFAGELLVSGTAKDGRISVWEPESGREVQSMRLGVDVDALALSPDGRLVVAGGADSTVHVIDLANGRGLMRGQHQPASASMPLRLGSRDGGIFAVAFHPNGKYVVSGGQDRAVILWEIASGREVFRGYQSDAVYGVAISPDGRWLASGGMDETARVWSLENGSERYRLQHKYVVQKVLWNADGDLLTVGGDGTARLWSMATGQELSRMYHADYIVDAALSADGRHAITADWVNGVVRVWRLSRGGAVLALNHPDTRDAVYSPDGTHMATIGETDYVQLWHLPDGKPLYQFKHKPFAEHARFSPDGKILVTTGWDGMAHLWEVATGKHLASIAHHGRVVDARFSPDGRTLVTAGFEDGTAGVWEVPSGRELFRLKHEGVLENLNRIFRSGGVRTIALDHSGRTLVTGGHDGTVRFWDLQDGRELKRFKQRGYIVKVLYTQDERYLIVDSEKDVDLWSLATGERVATIDKESAKNDSMSVLGLSADSRLLLVASSEEKSLQVRAVPDFKIVARLIHDDDVFSAIFNRDGSRLLTSGRDKTARIWDTRTWQEITRVTAYNFVYKASYSPDERFFVTASGDGEARVWPAELDAMVETACQRLRRNLTPEEGRQYLSIEQPVATCPGRAP
jgi:WD40 repeat protein